MRESFIRDRTGDDGSAAGAVDNSVVNWLMHVISGKAPTELGLNGAPEAEAVTESSQQKMSSSRDGAKETAAPSAPSMNVTAEDLCGAPVVPIVPGPVAYEPIVYEVVTGEDEVVEAAPTVSLPHEEVPTQVVSAPEWSGLLSFKRPTGPQLVDAGRAQVLPPATNQSLAVQLLRDDAPYEAPPASEVTRSIASSLRAGLSSTSETTAEPIDPLDLVRDPDYYEEKMRTREAEKVAVDWVKPESAEPVHKAEPVMPGFEAEPDLVQVVKHEVPIVAVHADPFTGVAENSQPSMQVGTAEAAPAVEVLTAATEPTVEPVAAVVAEPVVAAAAKVLDPFAGIEFGTTPAPEEQAAPVVAAPPAIPDPFAGVEFGTTSAPVAVEAVPEIAAAEPEVAMAAPEMIAAAPEVVEAAPVAESVAMMPEPVVEPVAQAVVEPVVEPAIEAASEPEVQVAPAVVAAPTVPAVPDPFAGIDFGTGPVEAETAEPIAAAVPEIVAAPAEAEAAAAPEAVEPEVAAAEPEAVEVAYESQVVAQEPELVEAAAVAEGVTVMPEPVIEPEVAPEAEAVAPVAEPEVPTAPAVAAMPAIVDPFAGIDFGTEQVAAVEAPESIAIEAEPEVVAAAPEPEVVAAAPEIVTAPEPEVVEPEVVAASAEPEVAPEAAPEPEVVAAAPEVTEAIPEPVTEPVAVAEPATVEIASQSAEVVPEAAAVAEAAQEPEAAEVPSEAEVVPEAEVATAATEAEAAPAAEAPVRSWSWMVPEAPPVMPEVAARATQVTEAARDTEFKPVIAAEVSQPQGGVLQPGKAFAEAVTVPPGEAKPEDLSAAIKTLMQLGSVLPLASRMAPREGETVQEPVAVDTQEVKQEVSGLRLLQYEIKTTVQDQSMHLKRLEDQLARMRESAEMDSAESASAMDNMKSTAKMVRVMGIGLGVMLLVLILLIGMVLMHVK